MDYSQKFSKGHKLLVETQIPAALSSSLLSRVVMKKSPIILANIIHTSHMEFHVDFSLTEDVMGCGPKVSSAKYKARARDTLS